MGSKFATAVAKLNAHSSTPTPVFLPPREETQTMVREELGPNSDHPRLCIFLGKEKLRPWSEFLGRENSDHGLSFGCFWGRGRLGGSRKHYGKCLAMLVFLRQKGKKTVQIAKDYGGSKILRIRAP